MSSFVGSPILNGVNGVHPQNLIHKTLLFLLAWAAGLVGNVHTWGIPRITNQQALTHKSKA